MPFSASILTYQNGRHGFSQVPGLREMEELALVLAAFCQDRGSSLHILYHARLRILTLAALSLQANGQ